MSLTVLRADKLTNSAQMNAITSVPALAAALRQTDLGPSARPFRTILRTTPLAPMYRIHGQSAEEEVLAAVYVLAEIAERLRRLGSAYGEWVHFDAGAYFDLTSEQVARLIRISERVSTVHVVFFADLLLPSFQAAEAFWYKRFRPDYHVLQAELVYATEPGGQAVRFYESSQLRMADRWLRLVEVVDDTRRVLGGDIGFMGANGGEDERARWRHVWERTPALGLAPELAPVLQNIPTLTLSMDFPLPAIRQRGRLRRLRQSRERRRRQRGAYTRRT